MAGKGPAPKDPRTRQRRNAQPTPLRVVTVETASMPELPDSIDWHEQTRQWWRVLGRHPLREDFTELDWSYLLDTALLHTQLWEGRGSVKLAGELRQRESKYAFTPEDRARLRIQFAQADEAEEKRTRKPGQAARSRRGPLKAADEPPADVG